MALKNLLWLYSSFSALVSLWGGTDHAQLVDRDSKVVEEPFLPLGVALWNENRTKCTLMFALGRIKCQMLPNQWMGRSVTEGDTYKLVVVQQW